MQQCTNCQADLSANAQFCSHCGASTDTNQALSTPLADTHSEDEDETTSKLPAVTVSASSDLPTLRNRRMHSQAPIPEFPNPGWFSSMAKEDAENILSARHAREPQDAFTPKLQIPLTPPIKAVKIPETPIPFVSPEEDSSPAESDQDASLHATRPLDEVATRDQSELSTIVLHESLENLSRFPTDALPDTPLSPAGEPKTSPTGDLLSEPAPADIAMSPTNDLAPIDEPGYTSPFPPPTPERRSTPRPAHFQKGQKASPGLQGVHANRLLLIALLVAVVLAGGLGAFEMFSQRPVTTTTTPCATQGTGCTNSTPIVAHGQPTHLTFAGSVAGPMTMVAKPRCESASAGNVRTLTVNLSGTINNQLYNFGFVIERYHGAGTYSGTIATLTILFDTPGQSTTNGWGNNSPTDTGSITVARGEGTGSISYTLSGVGTQANTQVQVTGNWTCGA